MKILILNKAISRYTIADYYTHAFQQLDAEIYILNLFYNRKRGHIDFKPKANKDYKFFKERLARRIIDFVWDLKKETRQRIIMKIKEINPDIVMAMGSIEIEMDIFKEIKDILKSCYIFCYLTDPLPTKSNLILEDIPFYDCIFTFSKFQIPLIYWFGAKKVVYLPLAYDPRIHRILSLPNKEKEFYGSDIAYLATWQPHIEFCIGQLTQYDLKIWGNQWYKSRALRQLKAYWQGEGVGLYEDMAKVINSSKIIFNVIRYGNGNSHSMKTFEIPACGGFMLSNRTEEQLEFFPEDKCAVYFSSREELKEKIQYYLKDEQERQRITQAGYEHCISSGYSYLDRAKQIIEVYEELSG